MLGDLTTQWVFDGKSPFTQKDIFNAKISQESSQTIEKFSDENKITVNSENRQSGLQPAGSDYFNEQYDWRRTAVIGIYGSCISVCSNFYLIERYNIGIFILSCHIVLKSVL